MLEPCGSSSFGGTLAQKCSKFGRQFREIEIQQSERLSRDIHDITTVLNVFSSFSCAVGIWSMFMVGFMRQMAFEMKCIGHVCGQSCERTVKLTKT